MCPPIAFPIRNAATVESTITIADYGQATWIINDSRFGLQASVFTKDEGAGFIFAKQLNVGSVQINGSPQRGPDYFPFLGVKHSGIGVQEGTILAGGNEPPPADCD